MSGKFRMKYLALPALRIPGGPPRRRAEEEARTRPGSNKNEFGKQ